MAREAIAAGAGSGVGQHLHWGLHMKLRFSVLAGAALAVAASNVSAQTFTDRAAFNAAVGSTTAETFNGVAPTILAGPSDPSVTTNFPSFQLTSNPNGDYVAISGGGAASNIDGSNFLYFSSQDPELFVADGDGDLGPTLTLVFGSAIPAFGFDWADNDETDSYRVDFSGPGFSSVGFQDPPFNLIGTGRGFFGFRSDTAFTTVTFSQNLAGGSVDQFGIDNLAFTSRMSAAVPEPGTWATMILGFGAVGGTLRRRRAAASALATA